MKSISNCLVCLAVASWLPAHAGQPKVPDDPQASLESQVAEQMQADKTAESGQQHLLKDPLSGIVINRTVTVLGNDFYQYFATAWRQKDVANKYSITVYERPSARWGSEVWVDYRHETMFRTFLSPARQAAREVSEQAAEMVHENVVRNEIQRMLVQSQDLGKEEL